MDYIIVKLALVVAGLIAFGIWQLRDINRSLSETAEQDSSERKGESDGPEESAKPPERRN